MIIFEKLKNKRTIQNCLAQGKAKEAAEDLEGAFEEYSRAAELGSSDAMVCIAKLYYVKMFRPVEENNLMELMLQGIPAFPWNLVNQTQPDYRSALEWFRKAADLNHPVAACMAGSMLCEGVGCKADKATGLHYLEIAAAAGMPEAQDAICIYRDHPRQDIPREQYESLLQQFSQAVEKGDRQAYALYDRLKCGSDALLARLGYLLMAEKNAGAQGFGSFQYSTAANGIPLLPVCPKRVAWKTFIRVDLNAFPNEDVQIAISSDLNIRHILGYVHQLTPSGTVVYRSPEFGWLQEKKHAHLFRIDRNAALSQEVLANLAEDFLLTEAEYQPGNVAFLTEYGEKEYSVEIAAIYDGKVDVLFRYTIGGSDTVTNHFRPELISICEDCTDTEQ